MVEIILFALCLAILTGWLFSYVEQQKSFKHERAEWKHERQMLLDRIQAPSFAEYTSKVVKEKKAEKPEEEEKPTEFIS